MKKVLLILSILIVLAAVVLGLFVYNGWEITINETNDTLVLEYGDPLELNTPTATVKGNIFYKNGKEIPVEKNENIMNMKVGEYEIIYSAKFLFTEKTIVKPVKIIDNKAPVITLSKHEGYTPEIGTEYIEEGYTAIDEYDGDITDSVTIFINGNEIHYTVQDSSGNETTEIRTITYVDTTKPIIELNGSDVHLLINQQYEEPGFVAYDSVDGILTDNVQVHSNLMIDTPGEYIITYNVSDNSGNVFETYRKITVVDPGPIPPPEDEDPLPPEDIVPPVEENTGDGTGEKTDGDEEITDTEEPEDTENNEEIEPPIVEEPKYPEPDPNKIIYLTFDDGPSKHTQKLLDVLAEYDDVQVTFFVLGRAYSNMITKIHEAGHVLGMHGMTHDYHDIYSSVDNFFADLEKIDNLIYSKTGIHTTLVRFPGGSSNTVSKSYSEGIMTTLAAELESRGYAYFDWNVSSGDAGEAKTTEEVVDNVIKGIGKKEQVIVLQHDTHEFSVDAVREIIEWGKMNGYTFKGLSMDSIKCHHRIYN